MGKRPVKGVAGKKKGGPKQDWSISLACHRVMKASRRSQRSARCPAKKGKMKKKEKKGGGGGRAQRKQGAQPYEIQRRRGRGDRMLDSYRPSSVFTSIQSALRSHFVLQQHVHFLHLSFFYCIPHSHLFSQCSPRPSLSSPPLRPVSYHEPDS